MTFDIMRRAAVTGWICVALWGLGVAVVGEPLGWWSSGLSALIGIICANVPERKN